MTVRLERVNQQLRKEISDLVRRELNDPRLSGLLSITEVVTTPDLASARVYVSIMAAPEEQGAALKVLASASGFLNRALRSRLRLRRVPELHFLLDTSIQQGSELLNRIDTLTRPVQQGGG
ncbi:MAG: 30S ribosome-binding factor RbfA [Chloroflexi bacterium]|nr:30S ribosome-binding factor RbfA [Chloroflexota bacterium]